MESRSTENSSTFPSIVTAVVWVAALYYGRDVLVPIALATLLTFLMAPLVARLERFRIGKTVPTLSVLLVALILIVMVSWIVIKQGIQVAAQLPTYSSTISGKLESIRGVKNSGLAKAASSIRGLGNQVSTAIQTPPFQSAKTGSSQEHPSSNGPHNAKPVPVEVVNAKNTFNFNSVRGFVGPVLGPIAKTAIVFVVAAFMLLRRKNLQERLFALAGLNRIHLTKQVFTEATSRVVRYLWLLCCVNVLFGVLFGTALYFLGLPSALLWGVLAGILRFIPYIGSIIGAGVPILLSFAVFEGWTKPLIALGVYLLLEATITYAVEPVLYASRTGISSLAILVSAIFWAALWGPVGLLLSTPLTVCIVVVGRYIPQLEFLSVLLGEKTSGAADVQLYQAITAGDSEEAQHIIDDYLREKPIGDLYDSVFIPVLVLAERDRIDSDREGQRRHRLFHELNATVQELIVRYPREAAPHVEVSRDDQILSERHPGAPAITVSCLPVRDEGDEVASVMLAHLLNRTGYDAHEIALGPSREMIDEVAEHNGGIVYVSALPPFAVSSIRRLYKRIQLRFPGSRIGVGLWAYSGNTKTMKSLLKLRDSDLLMTTLSEAALQIQQFVEPLENKPHQELKSTR